MIVGIAGLGLIGGSFAKAYAASGHTVLAYDIDKAMLDFAIMNGDVRAILDENNISDCELLLVALYPAAAVEYIERMAENIGKETIVIDCCGTKRFVCNACFEIAKKHGFVYIGGHPMAGTHKSGYKYAKANMFKGAPMVIVPPCFDDIELLDKVKMLLSPAGFGHISVTTADKHDEIIAFTSQMAHVVSNAFIKSPTALNHKGVSAGSYKDLTRVAWLNPNMWAELFLENKDCLLNEIDIFTANLAKYREAIAAADREELIALLDEGRKRKEEVDGR